MVDPKPVSARYSMKVGRSSLHVVGKGNLTALVTNDGESQLAARDLIDILDPSSVRFDRVGRQTDQLDATLGELGLELCECAELGGADGSIVFGMGEEDDPVIANEVVEVDGAGGGLSLEVWCDGSQSETAEGESISKET